MYIRTESILDITKLIENKVQESTILDYKQEIGSNKELCKDISSFANSEGGKIIYGVSEVNEVPKDIMWLNKSGNKERIQQVISAGIRPHLKIRIYSIENPEDDTKEIVVVDVPAGQSRPYRVEATKKRYCRENTVSGPVDLSEAREREMYRLTYEKEDRIKELLELKQERIDSLNKSSYFRIDIIALSSQEKFPISKELYESLVFTDEHQYRYPFRDSYYDFPSGSLPYGQGRCGFRTKGDPPVATKLLDLDSNGIITVVEVVDEAFYSTQFMRKMIASLNLANMFYEKVGYFGGVKIKIRTMNTKGKPAYLYTSQATKQILSDIDFEEVIEFPPIEVKEMTMRLLKMSYNCFGEEDFPTEYIREIENFISNIK